MAARPSTRCLLYSRFTAQPRSYAHQSYGGGEGDPKGEDPQSQGSNPSADIEHPGPPPPSVGRGTGGGPTKAHEDGHNTHENDSSNGSKNSGSQSSKGQGAQPKILSEGTPTELTEDAKKHNAEMETRHDRADKQVDRDGNDTVSKGFWSGKYSFSNTIVIARYLAQVLFDNVCY